MLKGLWYATIGISRAMERADILNGISRAMERADILNALREVRRVNDAGDDDQAERT